MIERTIRKIGLLASVGALALGATAGAVYASEGADDGLGHHHHHHHGEDHHHHHGGDDRGGRHHHGEDHHDHDGGDDRGDDGPNHA